MGTVGSPRDNQPVPGGNGAGRLTQTLNLVDTTQTSSWDDWAQGFRVRWTQVPNMSCPGQTSGDLFFFSLHEPAAISGLLQQRDAWNRGTTTPLPYNSQFKCYDGMHNWNQIQPAPYDGMYSSPA